MKPYEMKSIGVFVGMVLLGLLLACGGGDGTPTSAASTATSPAPTATPPAPGETPTAPTVPLTPTPTTPPIPAWQIEWEAALEGAKEDGVVIISGCRSAYRRGAEKFLEVYPDLNVEAQIGRGNEERWIREQDAGIYSIDVALTSSSQVLRVALPAGIVGVTREFFILPEVVDDENWIGVLDDHWVDDTKRHIFTHWASAGETTPYLNTELVPRETFTLDDLFTPAFRGKWAVRDPAAGGAGVSWLTEVMVTRGTDWIRRLLTETDPVFSQDDRAMAQDVIRGDLLFCAGCAIVEQFHEENVGLHVEALVFPVKPLSPEFVGMRSTCCGTGTGKTEINGYYSTGTGGPAVLKNAPHPNTTMVFLNWLEGSDGARAYLVTSGIVTSHCSARVDLQDICRRPIPMEDGMSYIAFDRKSTIHIEGLTAELIEEILGGR